MPEDNSVKYLSMVYSDLVGRIQGDRDTSWRVIGLSGIFLPLFSVVLTYFLPRVPQQRGSIVLCVSFLVVVCCIFFLLSVLFGVVSVLAFRPLRIIVPDKTHVGLMVEVRKRFYTWVFGRRGIDAWQTTASLLAPSRAASAFHTSAILTKWNTSEGLMATPDLGKDFASHLWEYCVFLSALVEIRKEPLRWALRWMASGLVVLVVALILIVAR
jgi:hypothetical protein